MDGLKVNLDLLTDDAILDYTTDESGRPHILYDYRDINMRFNKPVPYDGGVYDPTIFGSPMIDRCMCGKFREPTDHPCPQCGCRVYSIEEGLRRFARIELPFYYLNSLRFEVFKEFFDNVFSTGGVEIVQKFINADLRKGGYSGRGSKRMGIKVFDSCQFDYDPKGKRLTISEIITDETHCSYEGILKIMEDHFPNRVDELKKLINRYYLVLPTVMRPFTYSPKNGKSLMGIHRMSMWYGIIIRLCCAECHPDDQNNFNQVMNTFKTPGSRVRYIALLRAMLNAGKKEATDLLNASKKNLARTLYAVHVNNSMRCPIIPSTTLAIDEVSLPRHLAYEMCRSGFCKYLEREYNFTKEQAIRSTRDEYNNPEIQAKFKEYAEQQVVIDY